MCDLSTIRNCIRNNKQFPKLDVGDFVYLIEKKWADRFLISDVNPPIDNSSLLEKNNVDLKRLSKGVHFYLLKEEMYKQLVSQYKGGPEIRREQAAISKHYFIDLWPFFFKVSEKSKPGLVYDVGFMKKDDLANTIKRIGKALNLNPRFSIKIWNTSVSPPAVISPFTIFESFLSVLKDSRTFEVEVIQDVVEDANAFKLSDYMDAPPPEFIVSFLLLLFFSLFLYIFKKN
jgi:hypothetical protein